MNTVYIAGIDKWIRLDARGNKEGVNAEFSTNEEKLAFETKSEGEIDYHDNHSYPDESLMKVLRESTDAIDMYLHHLPDQLSYGVEYNKDVIDYYKKWVAPRSLPFSIQSGYDNL